MSYWLIPSVSQTYWGCKWNTAVPQFTTPLTLPFIKKILFHHSDERHQNKCCTGTSWWVEQTDTSSHGDVHWRRLQFIFSDCTPHISLCCIRCILYCFAFEVPFRPAHENVTKSMLTWFTSFHIDVRQNLVDDTYCIIRLCIFNF